MDYFNIDDTNLESTPYTAGDFDAYPFLEQTSATEDKNGIFADGWGVGVRPDHEVGLPWGLEAEASFGKHNRSLPDDGRLTHESSDTVASATPYNTQAHNDGALSFPEYYLPATGLHSQSHSPSIASWENSFTSTAVSEASAMVPVPSSGEYSYETSTSRVLTDRE